MTQEKNKYYIVSVKHTSKGDKALTFWAHNSRGYTWDKRRAGVYLEEELATVVNDENIAVSKEKVDPLWVTATDFGDKYVSVPNTSKVLSYLGISNKLMKPKKFASCRMVFDK